MKKRADGLYHVQATLDGKRYSFYGKTRKEADGKRAEARRAHAAGLPIVLDKQTVGQYLVSWLAGMKLEVDATTHHRYATAVNLHLVPKLGTLPLTKLTALHLKKLLADEDEDGYADGTLRHLYGVMSHALADAVKMHLLQQNIAKQMKPPKIAERAMQVLSEEHARQLQEQVAGDRLHALYVVALHTGMRMGELRALRWMDVDLERGRLQVAHTVHDLKGQMILAEPKTVKSRRTIGLSKKALAALKARRLDYAQEKLKAGSYWEGKEIVFGDAFGRILWQSTIFRHLQRQLKAIGVPAVRFHDLRHTAATILLSHGVNPKLVSEMLGHSSVAFTLQVYGHVLPSMQDAALLVMDTVLG
jgi:integrase